MYLFIVEIGPRAKFGIGARVGVRPRERLQEGALEIGVRDLLLLVEALEGLPINSLSARLIQRF